MWHGTHSVLCRSHFNIVTIMLLQMGGPPNLSEETRKRLDDIRRTLPDILGQVNTHTHLV